MGVQVHALAIATLALSAIDHWTTYVCLRRPISGWRVTEANPISDWMFQTVGLVPGLLVDSLLTVAAVLKRSNIEMNIVTKSHGIPSPCPKSAAFLGNHQHF